MNQKVLELFGVMIQKPPNYQLIRYKLESQQWEQDELSELAGLLISGARWGCVDYYLKIVNEVEMMKAEFYLTLDKRSKKELVDMIIQYADDDFILKALSGSSEKAKEQLIKKMYKQFDLIIKNNTYADGSIDYQNAYRFCDKLGEFIYPSLDTFFEDIGYMETFDFILHCAEDLAHLEYEDYDCGLYEIENELEYYLEEVFEKSTQDEKESIRKILKRFMADHPYFFSEEVEQWTNNEKE